MDALLLTSRLLLALVFGLAGITKLLDLPGSRRAVTSFGVPARLSASAGLFVPLAEIAIAVALIPRPTAWWGGLGAGLLLALFTAAIASSLARGQTPDCHCFGQLASAPIGPLTLLRNTVLAAVAGFVLWQGRDDPGASAVAWFGNLSVTERVLTMTTAIATMGLVAAGWLLLRLMRQHGRLLLRLDSLEARSGATGQVSAAPSTPHPASGEAPIGAIAPDFTLPDLDGTVVSLADLLVPGKPLLLVFSDPGCGSCTTLLPEIARWQQESQRLSVAVISRGAEADHRARVATLRLHHLLLQQDREVAQAYGVRATPGAVVVLPDRSVGSQVALGPVAIRNLAAPFLAEAPLPTAMTAVGAGPMPAPSALA